MVHRLFTFIVPWTVHWTHAISWSYRLLLWSADSFCGLSLETLLFIVSWTLLLVRRLFWWSLTGDSFVYSLVDSFDGPQTLFGGLLPETLLFIVSWTLLMVCRLFWWSLARDSFVYSLVDSFDGPQTLFVDLILNGQHAFAGLVVINLTC